MINQTLLEQKIQAEIAALTVDSPAEDFYALIDAYTASIPDYSVKLASVNDLPDLSTTALPNGFFIYVDSIGIPVFSLNKKWYSTDRRVLRDDNGINTVWGWGYNFRGNIGDGTYDDRSSPVSTIGGFTDWCQVDVNLSHSAAVRQNGTLWAWGNGQYGRLGDGTTVAKTSPVSVVGGFTDWCQVSVGPYHTSAVKQNGTLWAWGSNSAGTLGNSGISDTSSPVSVVGGFTDWSTVFASERHTVAIRQNGTLWSWGCNFCGVLGIGSTNDISSPVSVVGGFTDWCQVSSNFSHSAAVRQNGTIWTWGWGVTGRLGNNCTGNTSSPVSVVGGFTDWCQVSAGGEHTAAVRQNGTLWAWGHNGSGRLGTGNSTYTSSPVSVVGGFTDWCQVMAGSTSTVAIRQNGTIWSWGCGTNGRLGDNATVSRSSPVSVVGGFTDWCQISLRCVSTLAIRSQN